MCFEKKYNSNQFGKNNEQIDYMQSCNGSKSKLMIVDSLRTCKLSSISGKPLSPSVDLKYIYQDIITENISNPHNHFCKWDV